MSISKYLRDVAIITIPAMTVGGAILLAGIELRQEAWKLIDFVVFSVSGLVVGWLYAYDHRITSTPIFDRAFINRMILVSLGFSLFASLSTWIGGGFDESVFEGVPFWVIPLGMAFGFVKNTGILWIAGAVGSTASVKLSKKEAGIGDA